MTKVYIDYNIDIYKKKMEKALREYHLAEGALKLLEELKSLGIVKIENTIDTIDITDGE